MSEKLGRRVFLVSTGFLLGILFSWGCMNLFLNHYFNPDNVKERAMNRLVARLELTPYQQEKLDSVFTEASQKYKDLHLTQMKPSLLHLKDSTVEDVMQILDERQQEAIKPLMTSFDRKLDRVLSGIEAWFEQ